MRSANGRQKWMPIMIAHNLLTRRTCCPCAKLRYTHASSYRYWLPVFRYIYVMLRYLIVAPNNSLSKRALSHCVHSYWLRDHATRRTGGSQLYILCMQIVAIDWYRIPWWMLHGCFFNLDQMNRCRSACNIISFPNYWSENVLLWHLKCRPTNVVSCDCRTDWGTHIL